MPSSQGTVKGPLAVLYCEPNQIIVFTFVNYRRSQGGFGAVFD